MISEFLILSDTDIKIKNKQVALQYTMLNRDISCQGMDWTLILLEWAHLKADFHILHIAEGRNLRRIIIQISSNIYFE